MELTSLLREHFKLSIYCKYGLIELTSFTERTFQAKYLLYIWTHIIDIITERTFQANYLL